MSTGGDSRALNNALETINAAATAIAFAENRAPQASVRVYENFDFDKVVYILYYELLLLFFLFELV